MPECTAAAGDDRTPGPTIRRIGPMPPRPSPLSGDPERASSHPVPPHPSPLSGGPGDARPRQPPHPSPSAVPGRLPDAPYAMPSTSAGRLPGALS